MWETFIMVMMLLTAIFLILLILVQRGKGGGLAGAFGGMGGQSAFGTKAGDTFTKITIGVASFWILLCMIAVWQLQTPQSKVSKSLGTGTKAGAPAPEGTAEAAPTGAGGAAPAGQTK